MKKILSTLTLSVMLAASQFVMAAENADEGSAADIPEWVNKVGHEIVDSFTEEEVLHIVVKKIK